MVLVRTSTSTLCPFLSPQLLYMPLLIIINLTHAPSQVVEDKPEWVVTLTEECRELRDSNAYLKSEADQLRQETADIENKERELVQACLEQFSESLFVACSSYL